MESNINYQGISDYSRIFSDKVMDKAFSAKDKITGDEILSLTEIKQVNLFVLMNLFQKWKEEMNKIKSPYFDYSSTEVQKAIDDLMNVLSRNILVSKSDFKPILVKAVQQAILLIFSPYDYYRTDLFAQSQNIKGLKEAKKFIKVNGFLLDALIDQSEKKGLSTVDTDRGMGILDKTLEDTQETPEDFDPYLQQFSSIEPISFSQLYSEKEAKIVKAEGIYTLNDHFLQEPKPTLADMHRKVKIENIKNHITINQRFMFVHDLFNGNADEFNSAVDALENKQTFDEALEYLKYNYGDKNGWDMESETLVEFLDVLSKRY